MRAALIITDIFIIVFGFLGRKNYLRGRYEQLISVIHVILLLLAITCIFLVLHSYMFWGKYTHSIIGVSFLCSSAVLFAVAKHAAKRMYAAIILFPVILINIGWAGVTVFLLPALIALTFFSSPVSIYYIDKDHTIELREGFMGPQPVYLCSRRSGVFKEMRLLSHEQSKGFIYSIRSAQFISADSLTAVLIDSDNKSFRDTLTVN